MIRTDSTTDNDTPEGRRVTAERCVTGPPYQVATGGFVSLDPRQDRTYYETRHDQVRIENRVDHFLLWLNGYSARLDRATALELADAIREVAEVELTP